jgi:imidazolonepropionase-like amidohydrolase
VPAAVLGERGAEASGVDPNEPELDHDLGRQLDEAPVAELAALGAAAFEVTKRALESSRATDLEAMALRLRSLLAEVGELHRPEGEPGASHARVGRRRGRAGIPGAPVAARRDAEQDGQTTCPHGEIILASPEDLARAIDRLVLACAPVTGRVVRIAAICSIAACASQPKAGGEDKDKKKPVELDPVLGIKSPRGEERAVLEPRKEPVPAVAIVGATLLLGTGKRIEDGAIVLEGGKITALGAKGSVSIPKDARVIEGRGKFVTPGLIDTHSHLGVYAAPYVKATADGNEMTDPTTPYVFSEHSFWPQDPGIERAVAGGVTTAQILPGSGNIIGGRAVTLKLRPELEARAMRFPDAPFGLKMACGENPKRVYGDSGRLPMSRMGSLSKLRATFVKAAAYRHGLKELERDRAKWEKKYNKAKDQPEGADDPGKEPTGGERDLGMETLADALDGKILVHVHCYRADEMLAMVALSKELGFKISSFHHAVEAYKIADVLAKEGIGASMWADWWGFKLEAFDGIEENIALVAAAGGRAIVHSDSHVGIQRLNQEAAKALHAGLRAGLVLTEDQAIEWVTKNPATALGVIDRTGTLEVGKMADVVLWDRSPLSIYAAAEQVFIDGRPVYDRSARAEPWSDFEVRGTEVAR